MSLVVKNPITPGMRGCVKVDRSFLWKGRPEKSLSTGKKRISGRNNLGRITVRHRGGGHKRLYRFVDFKRRGHDGEKAKVIRIEYDPNRSAHLALLEYENGLKSYILHPQGVRAGDVLSAGRAADIKPGNALPLGEIPVGELVHNVELYEGRGGQLARAAGSSLKVMGHAADYVLVEMPSGSVRKIRSSCRASIGVVSNAAHKNEKLGKAGRSRWKGRRPSVRGVAMNPVDHPHGGGEGKTSGGRHPVTPWGVPTKGKKTRRRKFSDRLIVRGRS